MSQDPNEAYQRRIFQRVKGMTLKGFWGFMNYAHTNAYKLAEKHLIEAMEITLTPKQKTAVLAKAKQIREEWDGIQEITVKMDEIQEALDVALKDQ